MLRVIVVGVVMLTMVFCGLTEVIASTSLVDSDLSDGYLAAGYDNSAFIAVGTNGRADIISLNGEQKLLPLPTTEDLFDVCSDGIVTLICGSNGTMLHSSNRTPFEQSNINTDLDLFSIASSNGLYVVGSEKGKIFTSQDGIDWIPTQLSTENDIISVAANEQYFMAITKETDIFIRFRRQNWTHSNFNKTYEGFYKPQTFSMIVNMGPTFFVVGQLVDNSGGPLIMYTEQGEVWIPMNLLMINGEALDLSFSLDIKSLGYDSLGILAACDQGRLLRFSECVTCHKLYQITDQELTDITYGNGKLLVVGKNFYYDLITSETVGYQIQAEQVLKDLENGAIIIDVRTAEERFSAGYISESIHIPLSEIIDRLPEIVPDTQTELIFYCSKGGRAQRALEIALALGYELVYNLGGLTDWSYNVETSEGF